jgi:hypothetical protein
LALFLNSAFATYHQFLVSAEWGVQKNRTSLDDLKELPSPIFGLTTTELADWSNLHQRLVATSKPKLARGTGAKPKAGERDRAEPLFDDGNRPESIQQLMSELNEKVYELLQLDDSERSLIDDLVHVRMQLIQGKLGRGAVGHPSQKELEDYASTLKFELDEFLEDQAQNRHHIVVVHDDYSGMIQIELASESKLAESVLVLRADDQTAREFERTRRRLRERHSQWLYFERNLRIFEENRTYVFKPLQRLHWTRSQALVDADEIIADILTASGD